MQYIPTPINSMRDYMGKLILKFFKRRREMRKVFSLLAVAGIAVIATGCSTAYTHVSKKSAPSGDLRAKTALMTPEIAVGKDKIKGEATLTRGFWGGFTGSTKYADGIRYSSNIELVDDEQLEVAATFSEAKAAAAYDACQKNGADILIFPSYQLSVKQGLFSTTVHCEVSGFKGVIKGIAELEYIDDYAKRVELKQQQEMIENAKKPLVIK